jgi:hypothetical protein
MALKTLRCCVDSSLPEQRSTLRAINTLNPPKNYIPKLGGLLPIHSMRRHRAQGLMWGARVPFPPAAAMVVAVVTPVVCCAKATEKRNKNTKISWWLIKSLFITTTVSKSIDFFPFPKILGEIFRPRWEIFPLFFCTRGYAELCKFHSHVIFNFIDIVRRLLLLLPC